MTNIVGIDSRNFVRDITKKDGSNGHFESIIGVAIKVIDYLRFKENYDKAIKKSLKHLNFDKDFQVLCYNDIKDCENNFEFLESFTKEISLSIEKVHVFYTLFSKKRLPKVKVYGRLSHNNKIKLSEPTRTYEKLLSSHLTQCFPAICAWRLTEFLDPNRFEFHLDAYQGEIFEAQEFLEKSIFKIKIFPGGDCVNPVISTADLLIALIDKRLDRENKFLIFENIRPILKEFGEKVLAYPISNKHLKYITPLDKKPIEINDKLNHPVFWVFKGEEILDSGTLKRSEIYRNLQDYATNMIGVVKMFDKSKDINYFKDGDYGVHLNSRGKEQIQSLIKMGKKFKLFNLDSLVPDKLKE